MKTKQLTKAVSIILASSVATGAFAANATTEVKQGLGTVAEGTGAAVTNIGDAIYSGLTGKAVNKTEVNHPVSLYNYKQGTSAYEDAYFNGRFNAQDGDVQDQASYKLTLGTDYDKVSSSPDTNTKYEAKASASISRDGAKDAERQETWNLRGAITHDDYFNPATSKAFWYGKGEIEAKNEVGDSDYAGIDDPRVTLTGGLGYGRVVNVTPMAKAMRVVEALVQNGVIAGAPSAATYNNIASIISKEDEYRSKYGGADYAQMWVRDVERALGVDLGANGAIRVYNVLTEERISTRKYGWDVRAGVGVVATDYDGDSGKPVLEAAANYYYPISNRTQFSNETRFKTVLDDDSDSYNLKNSMGLTYEVSDRVDWINTWDIDYTSIDPDKGKSYDVTKNILESTYRYYISNSISADATVRYTNEDFDDNSTDLTEVLMGVNYRLK